MSEKRSTSVGGVSKMMMDLVTMHHSHGGRSKGKEKAPEHEVTEWMPRDTLVPLDDNTNSGSASGKERRDSVDRTAALQGSTQETATTTTTKALSSSSSSSTTTASSSKRRKSKRVSVPGPVLPQEMMVLVEAYMQRIAQRKRVEQESQNQKKEREKAGRRRIASCVLQ
jgi:hypothetical protein